MNRYFKTIYITCTFLLCSISQGEEEKQSILVSVARITSAEQSSSDTVQIGFIVHEPSEIRGSRFHTICASKNRTEVRTKYPLSSLFQVSLPGDLLNKLKEQKKEREGDESVIDKGVDPRMISNLVISPEVNFSTIEESISAYIPAQPAATGQRR